MIVIDTQDLDEKADKLSDSEVYWVYCALDCCVTYDVKLAVEKQLDEVARETYQTSLDTVPVVLEMMLGGIKVDLQKRREVLAFYEKQLEKLEARWIRLCTEGLGIPADRTKRTGGRQPLPINPASTKDIQYLFHTVLQIPAKKKRKKGQDEASVTTDRETLEGFRSYYFAEVFVNHILAMRDAAKAIGFLKTKLDDDNRIRCSFNVAGTKTGRLSSSFSDTGTGTNLQNISGKLKNIFVADPGEIILDIDLEQGDSRGVGAIAWNWFVESHGEEWAGRYLDACESGDLHTTVTRMAWSNLPWPADLDPKECKKIAEQIAYRDNSYRDLSKKLGHGCLTSDHQVLTREGWVPISEQPAEIMQWEEGKASFAKVSNWIAKPYTGELQIFEGNSISARMTHDHRVPYKDDPRNPGVKVCPAAAGPQAYMPLGDGWAPGSSITHSKEPATNVMVYCPTVPTSFFLVRRNGKIFVTGNSNYLGQPATMAQHAKLPVSTIVEFQKNYFGAFQCITAWQKETIRQLTETRCLITPFGRRRWFWDDPNAQSTKNAAIAYSPQSTTGEFINRGAIRLQRYRNLHDLPIRFLLQVHDSLVLAVKFRRLEELLPIILRELKVILPLKKGREFTIPHGVKVGWNYGPYDAHDNPYGLRKWTGHEDRTPPKQLSTFQAVLNAPINMS